MMFVAMDFETYKADRFERGFILSTQVILTLQSEYHMVEEAVKYAESRGLREVFIEEYIIQESGWRSVRTWFADKRVDQWYFKKTKGCKNKAEKQERLLLR